MADQPTTPSSEPVVTPEAQRILDQKKRENTSGLSWDETTPKPGENFNRATEMGEAD